VLNQFQLVPHLLVDDLGERPHPFQAVAHPFNRLKPFPHWLQYTRTHIPLRPLFAPAISPAARVASWSLKAQRNSPLPPACEGKLRGPAIAVAVPHGGGMIIPGV
jgi:hypothetical protein